MDKTFTLRTENLHWDKSSRCFDADASSLCYLPGLPMPRTLEVVSHRTGRTARYELHSQRTTREGEVVAWHYQPSQGDPAAQTTRGVTIWNT